MPASPWCSPACAISGIERCESQIKKKRCER
jgi:hypothetical protein